jgi:hypothetical protein
MHNDYRNCEVNPNLEVKCKEAFPEELNGSTSWILEPG